MTTRMLRAAAVCFGLAALVGSAAVSWQLAAVVAVVELALLIAASLFVGFEVESRPRVRRMAWRRGGIGPQEIRRLGELQRAGEHRAAGNQEGQVSEHDSKGLCASAGEPAIAPRPFAGSDGGSGVEGHAVASCVGLWPCAGPTHGHEARAHDATSAGKLPGLPPSGSANRLRLYGMGRCRVGWRQE
jgi:hypothetical protein